MAEPTIALVLSGGNALGAFQAGALVELEARGREPGLIAGGSIGAINGALFAGNPRGKRGEALATFWRPGGPSPFSGAAETVRRSAAAQAVLVGGYTPCFRPRLGWPPPLDTGELSLFDTDSLVPTLEALVDFGRLDGGAPRFVATAVDLETGEDLAFDTAVHAVRAHHVRASAALIPLFPPVEIDGRWCGDAGLSANLPLDIALADPPPGPLLCIAIDLMPLQSGRPKTLGEMAARLPDITFAIQARRAVERWKAVHRNRAEGMTLLHLPYRAQAEEVALKAFDYSPATVRQRWDAGRSAMADALDRIEAGGFAFDQPGFHYWRQGDSA